MADASIKLGFIGEGGKCGGVFCSRNRWHSWNGLEHWCGEC